MTGFALKLIAMITMLIDHTAAILLEGSKYYNLLRGIGRLAFPIYCFLLVEGYFYTKNVKRYLIRLGIFALISEIPFDLAFAPRYIKNGFLYHQNVFLTLFIGLVVIYLIDTIKEKYNGSFIEKMLLSTLIVAIGGMISKFLFTDYNMLGILIIVSFYVFREKKFVNLTILTILLYLLNRYFVKSELQVLATFAMLPIYCYNGKKGTNINRYIFYAFYPVHIAILLLIKLI